MEALKQTAFNKLDVDADGAVTVQDVMAVADFDSDADGQVSVEEAEAALDQDGDGALNETETTLSYAAFSSTLYDSLPDTLRVRSSRAHTDHAEQHCGHQARLP